MSRQPSSFPDTSEFRVEKARTDGIAVLSNGATITGAFFVSEHSASHVGPERVKDVLNEEGGFFPFEVQRPEGTRTVLLNRDHVLFVELANSPEAALDPGYDLAQRRTVSMLLSNGTRLTGQVCIYRPHGRDRLSDFARSPELFRYLESGTTTYLINARHLVELVEETS